MKTANIAEFKNHLSEFIADVENGEVIQVKRRNIPIAQIVPIKKKRKNQTKLGCGRGSIKILSDLTEPFIPESDWQMLSSNEDIT